ncbi:hypothetical protein [Undibacter mobilis]|uniref:Uncharacterized protein n=1 Tax=Undibacter mobilis TaxID=2292256 RepID=A0A371BBN4_9BRAD|nr:hypothetical protein [Undibacter mobilis]RDV04927.1 hypothetical protein DXH78_10355 [Undibacter mobilis]
MKSIFALALLGLVAAVTPSFAQDNTKVLGSYTVTGTETDGAKYDGEGTLAVTMDKSGALELKWDGGKYVGIGQVEGSKLFVGSVADGKVVIMVMDIKPDGSLEGKWWRRTDAGTKGTEVWKKK